VPSCGPSSCASRLRFLNASLSFAASRTRAIDFGMGSDSREICPLGTRSEPLLRHLRYIGIEPCHLNDNFIWVHCFVRSIEEYQRGIELSLKTFRLFTSRSFGFLVWHGNFGINAAEARSKSRIGSGIGSAKTGEQTELSCLQP
jgi:hypothetical protein